ncbi:MAG: proton-conducting transporter membrane subunit [Longimicrobiales bacterium]
MSPLLPVDALPLWVVLTSFLTGVGVLLLPRARLRLITVLSLAGATVKLGLVALMVQGVVAGFEYRWEIPLLPDLSFSLVGDSLALLFLGLSSVLWLVTTLYALGYLSRSANRRRFFAFFGFCIAATSGIALAGDLFTFVLFYEALTWTTYPLVVHQGTPEALRAGRKYLVYTLTAGTALIVGAVWFQTETGTLAFAVGGVVDADTAMAAPGRYLGLFLLLLLGVGVKSAFAPLHGWLPTAMVAPTPVSALLHAVAVVKAGMFGVIRILHSLFGIEVATDIGAAAVVAGLAGATIIYGSARALAQDNLKRLLAFSTVSQLSYIALGVTLVNPVAQAGGLAHLVHQGIMKITLFFCAGLLSETLGITKISEMAGTARRMPLTMLAFSVAALGMIGLPPVAGFYSKWYLGVGALQAGAAWVVPVLLISTALNAAYFLPIIRTAYLDRPTAAWPPRAPAHRLEADWRLLFPALVTAALALAAGLLVGSAWSAIDWADLIIARGLL